MSTRQRDRFRGANLGVVFQQFNLIPYLSALDNVLLAARFGGAKMSDSRQRATTLLKRVNLPPALHQRPASALSIGQQQRVAIVRALIILCRCCWSMNRLLLSIMRNDFLALLFDVIRTAAPCVCESRSGACAL